MNSALHRFFEERRRSLAILGLVLVGNFAFYLLLTAPNQLRVRALRGDVASAEQEATRARQAYGLALLETRLVERARATVDELYSGTFRTLGQRYAVVDSVIKDIANRFRLSPHAISRAYSPMPSERLEKLDVAFNLKGSYDSLRRFVAEVEQAKDPEGQDLFLTIEKVGLSDSSESGSELNLNIAVSTYFHKPELAQEGERRSAARRSAR